MNIIISLRIRRILKLELKDVSAYLDDAADRNRVFGPLSLQAQTEEICTIIGTSGCGKTSLLRTLAGLEESFDGSIQIDGKALRPITSKIAYVPQTFGLLEFKTVRQNILLPLKIRDISFNKELISRFCKRYCIIHKQGEYRLCSQPWSLKKAGL